MAYIIKVINNSCGTLAALNAVMNIPPRASEYKDEVIEHGVSLIWSRFGSKWKLTVAMLLARVDEFERIWKWDGFNVVSSHGLTSNESSEDPDLLFSVSVT